MRRVLADGIRTDAIDIKGNQKSPYKTNCGFLKPQPDIDKNVGLYRYDYILNFGGLQLC
jgi:hypothetical protein